MHRYRKIVQKFQSLLVQMKIFTEAESRGISASVKLHFCPSLRNQPTQNQDPHPGTAQESKDLHFYSTPPATIVSGIEY